MKKVIFIIGLPGSGKTHLLNQKYKNDEYIYYDDIQSHALFNNGNFTYSQKYPMIITEMGKGEKDIVISDIRYCNMQDYMDTVQIIRWWIDNKNYPYEIDTIVFQNEPEKCKNNVRKDTDRNVQSRLDKIIEYTKFYNPPLYGVEILDVYSE